MKRYICALLFSILVLVVPAHAYNCTGTVAFVGLDNTGKVTINGPGSGGVAGADVSICQLGATANGWTPDACKAAYSALLAAKLSGQQVILYYSDNLTCSTQPSWPAGYNQVYLVGTN